MLVLKAGSPRQSWPITKQNGNNRFQHFTLQPMKCRVQNNEISTCSLAVKSFGCTAWTWLLNFNHTLLMVNLSDFNDLNVKWASNFKLFGKTVWTVCAWRIWILRLNCQLLLALQWFLHFPRSTTRQVNKFISAIPERTFTTYVNLKQLVFSRKLKTAKFDSVEINSLQKKKSTDRLEYFFSTLKQPAAVYIFPRNENSNPLRNL